MTLATLAQWIGPFPLIAMSFVPLLGLWWVFARERRLYTLQPDGRIRDYYGKLIDRGLGVVHEKELERAASFGWYPVEADLVGRPQVLVQKGVLL